MGKVDAQGSSQPTHVDVCKLEVLKLCERLSSENVADGNLALAETQYLFAQLDALSADRLLWSHVTPSSKRALAWGRLTTSRHASMPGILQFIDVNLRESINLDSHDHLGRQYPALGYLRSAGLGGLSHAMLAIGSSSKELRETQLALLSFAVLDVLGSHLSPGWIWQLEDDTLGGAITKQLRHEEALYQAYVSRFRDRASKTTALSSFDSIQANIDKILRGQNVLAMGTGKSTVVFDVNWLEDSKGVRPATLLRKGATNLHNASRLTALANDILRLTDIDLEGRDGSQFGLYWWTTSKVRGVMHKQVAATLIPGRPIGEQSELAKRALLLLAVMQDDLIAPTLVRRIDEVLVLDADDGTWTYPPVKISELCAQYGDGIIDAVVTRVSSDHRHELNDASIATIIDVFNKACGDSLSDANFMRLYLDRSIAESRHNLSLVRLRSAMSGKFIE